MGIRREYTVSRKDEIIERLKENGCRITRQRRILIDIILENDCASCKEIFYKASQEDKKIGAATVYRMINVLEEIGAISRKNMYRVENLQDDSEGRGCVVVLDDNTTCHLSPGNWNMVVREGMKRCGYLKDQKVTDIKIES